MTDAMLGPTPQVIRGPVGSSEHPGYIRFFTSENRQVFYDLPVEWILELKVGGAGATGASAKPAYPDGDTRTPIDFAAFLRDITGNEAPNGLGPVTGGGQS